jgi:hypothetical protein
MSWTEPETWIVLALAFGLGMGGIRGGKALYQRYSTRPPKRPRKRRGEPDTSMEPPPYRDDEEH